MEGIPEYLDYSEIMETFLSIDGVVRVHNLRIWVRKTFIFSQSLKGGIKSGNTIFIHP
jgi:Co/Zn/Cd efflux system component